MPGAPRRRRQHPGRRPGFRGGGFAHRASREGDPLLHTHVVAGNLTRGPDGRWTALDARHIYRQAKTAGYLYQAVLRRELTKRLGLQWQPVERGVADVDGVSRSVVEHFSQRRAQILEHMTEHGGRSAASAQIAALETRRAKSDVPVDRLREVWRSRAAEHGLDLNVIRRIVSPGRPAPPARMISVPALTEEASAFGRPELLQHLAEAQPSGATIADLERLADAVLDDGEVVRLEDGAAAAGVVESRFTTRDLLETERELLRNAAARRDARVGVAEPDEVVLAERGLSAEQRRVVRDLVSGGEGVAVVRAAAGTGKTFVLDAAREAWQRSGLDVIGCAVSARAALELQDQAGIESLTVARLRHEIEHGTELPFDGVLVVDEAGMLGTRALADLESAVARSEGKLVLVGDDRQLPEIQAGGAFHGLAERLGANELHEVRRQREEWDRAALEELRNGEVERWARAYREQGRITVARSAPAARAALVNDWSRAGGDRLMIAARRDDVRDLNERARELLQANGELGPDELDVAGRAYAVGDRVVARRNDREREILNGQRGTIRTIDAERRRLDVELDGGKRVSLDAGYLDEGHLDYGYAITAHRAQGARVDRTFVLGSEDLYREWGYTALSRHRDEGRFYVARGDLGLDRDHAPEPDELSAGLERLMGRSRAKELALDRERDTHELRQERDDLAEKFEDDPPPVRQSTGRQRELEQREAALVDAREHEAHLRERREATRWFDRRTRAQLDEWLGRTEADIERLDQECDGVRIAHDEACAREQSWLVEHGPEAERYVAVVRELDEREVAGREATHRLERLAKAPPPLERSIELPRPDLDAGLDMGFD